MSKEFSQDCIEGDIIFPVLDNAVTSGLLINIPKFKKPAINVHEI